MTCLVEKFNYQTKPCHSHSSLYMYFSLIKLLIVGLPPHSHINPFTLYNPIITQFIFKIPHPLIHSLIILKFSLSILTNFEPFLGFSSQISLHHFLQWLLLLLLLHLLEDSILFFTIGLFYLDGIFNFTHSFTHSPNFAFFSDPFLNLCRLQVLYLSLKTLKELGHEHVYTAAEKPLLFAQTAAVLEVFG